MARFSVIVKRDFSAAHALEGDSGRCSRMHGHTWRVEARFSGPGTDQGGMLVDFDTAGATLHEVVAALDHRCLNELEPFVRVSPTAENVAFVVFERLDEKARQSAAFGDVRLESVTVWESRDSAAVYSA